MRNRLCPKNTFLYCLLAFLALTVTSVEDVAADEAAKYQKILERWSQGIPDLEKTDTGETAKDIALIRSWIGQAQAFVASEKFEKIDPLLAQIEALVRFVRVRQDRVKMENTVKVAKNTLAELRQTITETKAEADAMLEQIKKAEKK